MPDLPAQLCVLDFAMIAIAMIVNSTPPALPLPAMTRHTICLLSGRTRTCPRPVYQPWSNARLVGYQESCSVLADRRERAPSGDSVCLLLSRGCRKSTHGVEKAGSDEHDRQKDRNNDDSQDSSPGSWQRLVTGLFQLRCALRADAGSQVSA